MTDSDKSKWPRLYMRRDERLPVSYSYRTDRKVQTGKDHDGKPIITDFVYSFGQGVWTPVDPADLEKLQGITHQKNGMAVPLFGEPEDDRVEPQSVPEQIADLKSQLDEALAGLRQLGVQVGPQASDGAETARRICKSCNNVNAPGAAKCAACGNALVKEQSAPSASPQPAQQV